MEQLTLSILPAGGKNPAKGKAKALTKLLDILVDATLKLKRGVHYGLLGRNGIGKSSRFSLLIFYAVLLTPYQPCSEL